MLPTMFQTLASMLALAINEHMQRKLDYTREEGRVLRDYLEQLTGTRHVPFTDDQRRRLWSYFGMGW